MKKTLLILIILYTNIFSQDILITKKGTEYKGEFISINKQDDFIYFKSVGMITANQVRVETIERLVLSDGAFIIKEGKIIDKEKNFGKDTSEILFVDTKLRPKWNFHEPKDPFKSGMLSAIVPSGGHFYNEQYSKGWSYLFGVPLLYLAGSLIAENNLDKDDDDGIAAGVLIQFSALILHFYNVYDAVISSNNINKEYLRKYLEQEKTLKQNN